MDGGGEAIELGVVLTEHLNNFAQLVTVSTKGELPEQTEATVDYTTETEARLSWPPLEDQRLQHYEVVLAEIDGAGKEEQPERVERMRLGPNQSSAHFSELKPDTEYKVGVLAYV